MRIISLEPFITETVIKLGLGSSLVGVSHLCQLPDELSSVARITSDAQPSATIPALSLLSHYQLDLAKLKQLAPDLLLARVHNESPVEPTRRETIIKSITGELQSRVSLSLQLKSYQPASFEGVLSFFETLAKDLKIESKGIELSHRLKAQIMDWGDNFYERMKNKKVCFLSNVFPFKLGGYWIPDLIHLASAHSQSPRNAKAGAEIAWDEVVAFRPDVIIVAPDHCDLNVSLSFFARLEKQPHWEDIPAVKRGEVIFTDGKAHFHQPTPSLIESMAILVSAIAGLESGYITPRDSFFRLRWLELNRHKLT